MIAAPQWISLVTAVALSAAADAPTSRQPGAEDHQEHGQAAQLLKCASVCAECQLQCDSCFKHCLKMLSEGQKQHALTAQLCVDCAECCKACATLCARQSPLAGPMLECCAECCDRCAEECEKSPDDKHMAACAKACRECAKTCRDQAKALGNQ